MLYLREQMCAIKEAKWSQSSLVATEKDGISVTPIKLRVVTTPSFETQYKKESENGVCNII